MDAPVIPMDGTVGVGDLRRRSVERLMSQCDFYRPHARQVCYLSGRIGSQLAGELLLGPEALHILAYAALLHDIGWHFGAGKHHRRSYELIKEGGLSGFTPEQVEQIALVARYHRRARPKLTHRAFARLNAIDRQTVTNLAAILRVADGLDRSHRAAVEDVAVHLDGRRARFVLKTRFDDVDQDLTAAGRKKGMLEDALERAIVLIVGPDPPDVGSLSW